MTIDPYAISYQDVCGYVEFIAMHGAGPNTIRNKLSSIRTHMGLVDAHVPAMVHPRVNRALDAIERDKTVISRVKEPLPPDVFRDVLINMPDHYIGNIARAALLVLYYGALRQSEIMPRSVNSWDPRVQTTRVDCMIETERCVLFIKHAKNLQKFNQNKTVIMAVASHAKLCPVSSLRLVLSEVPTQALSDPLFMFRDSRKAVPSSIVLNMLHDVMRRRGHQHLIQKTSLHSIRKAAATNAHLSGCSELSIQNYGGWNSDAHKAYIRTSNQRVNKSLIDALDI